MNANHRKVITANIEKLIERTDVGALLPKLVEKGVFLENMVLKYQNSKGGMEMNLKRDLYLSILTRGPAAFRNLISALHDSGHSTLALVLEPEAPIVPQPIPRRVHPCNLPKYLEDPDTLKNMKKYAEIHPQCLVNLSTEPLIINVKKSTKQMDRSSVYKTPIYAVSSRPKGYAMIINIKKYDNVSNKKDRVGAEHDEKNLALLFKQLGYEILVCENLTGKDMMVKIANFAKDRGHLHVDSCILTILSHGEQVGDESYFVAADGEAVGVNTVLELFSNEKCDVLQKKPKIFLFQSCRGDRISHGMKLDSNRTKTDGVSQVTLRSYSDMLIAYSTVIGHQSHRDLYLGTWFIQAICEVFMEHACDTEIMEMLKLVDDKLEILVSEHDTMQTTCFENRGFKTFFFNPGIYDDVDDK